MRVALPTSTDIHFCQHGAFLKTIVIDSDLTLQFGVNHMHMTLFTLFVLGVRVALPNKTIHFCFFSLTLQFGFKHMHMLFVQDQGEGTSSA